jgi:hypothetical protein
MTRAPRGERHTVTRVRASGHQTVRDVCTRRPVQPRCAALAQAPPMAAKLLLPRDHRVWLDEHQSGLPTGPEAGQPDPEQAIGPMEARPMGRLLVNRPLLPQRQVCQAPGCPEPEESHSEDP